MFPDKKLSFRSVALAVVDSCLFWEMIARERRFDERADFDVTFEMERGDLEVVHKVLAEQTPLRSWLLECLSEVRSIAPANADRKRPNQEGFYRIE